MATALIASSGCGWLADPDRVIAEDRARYPALSAARAPGSGCGPEDSASVRRRRFHPRFPTGGWGSVALVDEQRKPDHGGTGVVAIGNELAGFVRFDQPGRLRARSYDDVYGEVYCGWAPREVEYTPGEEPTYMAFSRCAVGDGGLDQVHELCWFPAGAEDGEVVFSTAHPDPTSLELHEVYRERHYSQISSVGGAEYFVLNEREALRILQSLLLARKADEARTVVHEVVANLPKLPQAVSGATGESIPGRQVYAREWLTFSLLEAGLGLFDERSAVALERAREVVDGVHDHCHPCDLARPLLPMYGWAVARVNGHHLPVPTPPADARPVHGWNPRVIAEVLGDPSVSDATLRRGALTTGGETTYFWLALREHLAGDDSEARRYLEAYLDGPGHVLRPFELSAAVVLSGRLSDSSD
jgi:hypothetical protein